MARSVWILIVAAALTAVFSGTATRADEGGADERVVVRFEGPVPLEDFIRKVGESLDLPLVWDPKSRALQNKEVLGEVKLQGTKTEILEGLRSLLTFYELVMIPVGDGANRKIVVMDARQTSAIMKLKPTYVELGPDNLDLWSSRDGQFVTTTIQVEHMENLRDARNALNRIVTGQNIGNVTEVPAARAFVVTDFAPNVVAIYRLLRKMDVPFAGDASASEARGVVFRAVRLKHAQAKAVATTLELHFGANGVERVRPGPRPSQQQQQQQTDDVPPTPELRIHADERLNQVLVTGMRTDVDKVLEVIASMDQPVPAVATPVQYIRLAHIDAARAAASLTSLIHGYPGGWQDAGGRGALPAVEAHAETNGLLIQAPEAAVTALRRLIAEMDQPTETEDSGTK